MSLIYSLRKRAQERDPIPPGAVYVGRGRGSKHGNPCTMTREAERERACDWFDGYATAMAQYARTWLDDLIDMERPGWDDPSVPDEAFVKDMVCWCQSPSDAVKRRCHAETLVRLTTKVVHERRRGIYKQPKEG